MGLSTVSGGLRGEGGQDKNRWEYKSTGRLRVTMKVGWSPFRRMSSCRELPCVAGVMGREGDAARAGQEGVLAPPTHQLC